MKNTTIPIILKGKKTRSKTEQAKQKWFVAYYVDGVRKRLSNGLNRIKDYETKLKEFNHYRDEVERSLMVGGVPEMPTKNVYPLPQIFSNSTVSVTTESPSVETCVNEFLQYHQNKGSRQNTLHTYKGKLKLLIEEYGQQPIDSLQYKHIDTLLLKSCNMHNWSPKTFNNAKRYFVAFFHWAISYNYTQINPACAVKTKHVPKSQMHKAFSKEQFATIMKEVAKNKLLNLFVQGIFFTCARPRELSHLKIKHIDFEKRTLFIPASISKNKRDATIQIEPSYFDLLSKLFKDAPKECYLFTRQPTIYGRTRLDGQYYYRWLIQILKELDLDKQGFTLYSFKHYSNIQRFQQGWTLSEIAKGNRHSTIEQTEVYLRELLNHTDISNKPLSLF